MLISFPAPALCQGGDEDLLVAISDWKADYNHRRRHSALGYQAPAVYAAARTHP